MPENETQVPNTQTNDVPPVQQVQQNNDKNLFSELKERVDLLERTIAGQFEQFNQRLSGNATSATGGTEPTSTEPTTTETRQSTQETKPRPGHWYFRKLGGK